MRYHRPTAPLNLVESATDLLLASLGRDAWIYYLGAVPCVAAAVWIAARLAGLTAPPAEIAAWALLLTVLYGCKTIADGIFLRRLAGASVAGSSNGAGTRVDRAAQELAARALLIGLWLLLLPLAFAAIPLYFAAQLRPLGRGWRAAVALAWRQYRRCIAPLLIGGLAATLVATDLAVAAAVVPGLAADLSGAQAGWVRALPFLDNSTLLLALVGLLYLLFDPWLKAVAVVIQFDAEAAARGADLRRELEAIEALELDKASL